MPYNTLHYITLQDITIHYNTLHTLHTVHAMHSLHTLHTLQTLHTLHTLHMLHTLHTLHTLHRLHTLHTYKQSDKQTDKHTYIQGRGLRFPGAWRNLEFLSDRHKHTEGVGWEGGC